MASIKWFVILLYWLWLDYRNIQANEDDDWRLWIQILINSVVIILLVLEEV